MSDAELKLRTLVKLEDICVVSFKRFMYLYFVWNEGREKKNHTKENTLFKYFLLYISK